MATPNRVFGEQVLVATDMSDKWSERSTDLPVLLLNGEGKSRYSVFHLVTKCRFITNFCFLRAEAALY
ncbi:hypothetical protein Hanom_Chr15g01406191 [Helianthus anomalus]